MRDDPNSTEGFKKVRGFGLAELEIVELIGMAAFAVYATSSTKMGEQTVHGLANTTKLWARVSL